LITQSQIDERVKAFVAAQNANDLDALVAAYSPDGARVMGAGVTRGRAALRETYDRVWKALTNRTMTLNRVTVSGSRAVIEYTEHATHAASVETAFGVIPASHAEFDIHGCGVLDYDDDGIRELTVYSDALFQMLALSERHSAGASGLKT
jgi:hypothetical protein